ncbi:hypothetical protein ACFQZ4_14465 [Catellatospora coxensis]
MPLAKPSRVRAAAQRGRPCSHVSATESSTSTQFTARVGSACGPPSLA